MTDYRLIDMNYKPQSVAKQQQSQSLAGQQIPKKQPADA